MNDNAKMGLIGTAGLLLGAGIGYLIRHRKASKEMDQAILHAGVAAVVKVEREIAAAKAAVASKEEAMAEVQEKVKVLAHERLTHLTAYRKAEGELDALRKDIERQVSLARAEGYLEGERDAKAAAKPPKAERPPRPRPQPRSDKKPETGEG